MKKVLSCLVVMSIIVIGFAQSANDNFAGNWKTEEGIIISISNNSGKLTGIDPKGRSTLYNVRFKKNE